MSIASDLREAATDVEALNDMFTSTPYPLVARLRAHADTLERIEGEMKALASTNSAFRRRHEEWADALKGEMT